MKSKEIKRKASVGRYFVAVVARKESRNRKRFNLKNDDFEKVSYED